MYFFSKYHNEKQWMVPRIQKLNHLFYVNMQVLQFCIRKMSILSKDYFHKIQKNLYFMKISAGHLI